jgi:hypothetical protein
MAQQLDVFLAHCHCCTTFRSSCKSGIIWRNHKESERVFNSCGVLFLFDDAFLPRRSTKHFVRVPRSVFFCDSFLCKGAGDADTRLRLQRCTCSARSRREDLCRRCHLAYMYYSCEKTPMYLLLYDPPPGKPSIIYEPILK